MTASHSGVPFSDLGAGYAEVRLELDAAWQRVLASGRLVLGPEVDAFETEFARYCGAAHCVGEGLSLPMWPQISEAQQLRVAEALHRASA